ncbi:MAG: hypothetical protein EA388_14525 [Nitriliruptor sp.]|nr:MAG: hypothetical protein EA388_14525 [Nitriliruptor sp.]
MEWANVALLAVVLLWWLPAQRGLDQPQDTWLRLLAYLPVAALLLVGGWYWHRKLHQLRDGRPMESAMRVLDVLDRVLLRTLLVCSALIVAAWVVWAGTTTDRVWATGFVLFSWAEFVNYFRVQLMHDTRSDLKRLVATRRLRASWLAADLAEYRQVRRQAR